MSNVAWINRYLQGVVDGADEYADVDTTLEYCVRAYARDSLPADINVDALVEACDRYAFMCGAYEAALPLDYGKIQAEVLSLFGAIDS